MTHNLARTRVASVNPTNHMRPFSSHILTPNDFCVKPSSLLHCHATHKMLLVDREYAGRIPNASKFRCYPCWVSKDSASDDLVNTSEVSEISKPPKVSHTPPVHLKRDCPLSRFFGVPPGPLNMQAHLSRNHPSLLHFPCQGH